MKSLARGRRKGKWLLLWLLTLIAPNEPDQLPLPRIRAVVPWIVWVRLKTQTFVFLISSSLLYLIFLLAIQMVVFMLMLFE
jgi:hypothetical protein